MASALYRLGRWCASHAKRVVALWLVALVALGILGAGLGRPLSNEVTIPGSDFERVLAEVQDEVPAASGGFGTVVLHSETGTFSPEQRRAIRDVFAQWEDQPEVREVKDPFDNQDTLSSAERRLDDGRARIASSQRALDRAWVDLSRGQGQIDMGRAWLDRLPASDPHVPEIRARVAEGTPPLAAGYGQWAMGSAQLHHARHDYAVGRAQQAALGDSRFVTDDGYALAQVQFTTDVNSVDPKVKESIPQIGSRLEDAGVTAEYSVDITQENSLLGPGEVVGVAIAAMVLLLALGSLVAAGLPLVGALVGVGVGMLGALVTTHVVEMHSMTPSLALMLGLAVGIDYALFIVNRHRTQLLAGHETEDSIARAVGTSGSAVVVAGATVVIALVALLVTGIPLLAQMGLVAAATVAVAVLVALTLTPALLHLVGTRVISRRAWARAGFTAPGVPAPGTQLDEDGEEHGGWYVRLVARHPGRVATAVVAVCALVAAPALSLRLGLPDGAQEPTGSTAHTTYEQAAEHFGAGANGPVIALARTSHPVAAADLAEEQARVASRLHQVGGVHAVVPIGVSEDRTALAFQVVPETGPADEETVATVRALQATTPSIAEGTGWEVGLTGQTVANIEVSEKLGAALPPYLAIVVGLSLVLLAVVFRSLWVPVVATLGFLLSVAVSFGATVAVYQRGWLGGLLGVSTPGPILSFMPIMLIGVLFGLAMDYQMFLVSGMKEAHSRGEPARRAVITGFSHGAKVVTAAAVIMACVFAGFVFAHLTMIRPIGFGLAVGVLVDAVLVRMTLVPALMTVLDERAWAFPAWLRWVPHLDVEGASLEPSLAPSSSPA